MHEIWRLLHRRAGGKAMPFLREIGWRDFNMHLLSDFPALPWKPWQEKFAAFPAKDDAPVDVAVTPQGNILVAGSFGDLGGNWEIYEAESRAYGHDPDRGRWRLCLPMHLAETREQARREDRVVAGWGGGGGRGGSDRHAGSLCLPVPAPRMIAAATVRG